MMFLDPYSCMMYPYLKSRREAEEKEWIEWVEKELQFAKEMREAFGRVDGSSIDTGASESAGSKRSRDGDSSGSNDGASKRPRS